MQAREKNCVFSEGAYFLFTQPKNKKSQLPKKVNGYGKIRFRYEQLAQTTSILRGRVLAVRNRRKNAVFVTNAKYISLIFKLCVYL